ncbi:MAG: histidine phosphatase family protein [Eubacteriales bacterium]|nr:histidine phosphatase family protein [Eubacteriales bacterium]
MKLYLVRHGETDLNRIGGNFQGQIEKPLNADGERQAAECGEEFRQMGITFDQVISSPQGRAMRTAELVSGWKQADMWTDDRIKEMAYGPFEGKNHDEMDPYQFYCFLNDAENYIPPKGGESYFQVIRRCADFLEDMKRKRPGENVLVSCHGGTIRAILVHLHAAGMTRFWSTSVGNCAWYELTLQEDGNYAITRSNPKAEQDNHP